MYKCILLAFKGSLFFKKGFRDGGYAIHTSMHLQKSFVAAGLAGKMHYAMQQD